MRNDFQILTEKCKHKYQNLHSTKVSSTEPMIERNKHLYACEIINLLIVGSSNSMQKQEKIGEVISEPKFFKIYSQVCWLCMHWIDSVMQVQDQIKCYGCKILSLLRSSKHMTIKFQTQHVQITASKCKVSQRFKIITNSQNSFALIFQTFEINSIFQKFYYNSLYVNKKHKPPFSFKI